MRTRLAILILSLTMTSVGQTPRPSSTDEFQNQVLPVLSKTCMNCHNDRLQTAGLSFEPLRDAATAAQKPELWLKVLDKLNAGSMPPRPMAALTASELAAVTEWIRKLPAASAGRMET